MPDSVTASGGVTSETTASGTSIVDAFRRDVLAGFRQRHKTIPSKYLYDARGSDLFDQITRLDAYYPTETERAILREHIGAIAAAIGDRPIVVEYGSGSSDKTRILLDALQDEIAAYVPIDISPSALSEAAERLRQRYTTMKVLPVAADYTQPLALPALPAHDHIVVFFPGSTIGNFEPDEAQAFLAQAASVAASGGGTGGLLIGADQRKPLDVLIPAYDDPEGVTAAFDLNLLARVNRELEADFDLSLWRHEARWNDEKSRIEMHLVSQAEQRATVAGEEFAFARGETIHTEISTKYGPDDLAALAASAGWSRRDRWTDARGWFAVERYTLG